MKGLRNCIYMCHIRNMINKNGDQKHFESQWLQSDLCGCGHFRSHHPKLKRFTNGSRIPIGGRCEDCSCNKFVLKEKREAI